MFPATVRCTFYELELVELMFMYVDMRENHRGEMTMADFYVVYDDPSIVLVKGGFSLLWSFFFFF